MSGHTFYRFGRLLTRLRNTSGRSQLAVAFDSGLQPPRLCAIERGRTVGPNAEVVERLAGALDLPEEERRHLAEVAARDRVMREATRNLPPASHAFVAAALDAAVELSSEDLKALEVGITAMAAAKVRLRSFLPSAGSTRSPEGGTPIG